MNDRRPPATHAALNSAGPMPARASDVKVYEYRAAELFRKHGIPTVEGYLAQSVAEIRPVTAPVVVKAQVLTGGRGKAGGVKIAATTEEAREVAGQILGMDIKGFKVHKVYVVPKVQIAHEIYLSFIIDRAARCPVLLASAAGGVEIEAVPEDQLVQRRIHPSTGIQEFHIRELLGTLKVAPEVGRQIADMTRRLYRLFVTEDAELVEINPLMVLADGKVIAGDAKLVTDSDASFRHPEWEAWEDDEYTELEQEARAKSISFIQLDGSIGVIANGAGLTMATLDALMACGGKGGVFLDLGGTDDPEKVTQAFELMVKAKPSVILMNIFGGITKCDTVALGVSRVVKEQGLKIPIVARIKGLHEVEAKKILHDAGLTAADHMEEAAQKAVEMERHGGGRKGVA